MGVCWGGSGKWVYFRSSPGSCRSEFVAPGITNASLRQLAAGDESDRQHHGTDPSPSSQLGAMALAEVLVMSSASAQGEPWHQNASGLILLPEISRSHLTCSSLRGRVVPSAPCCLPGASWSLSLMHAGGLRWLHELLSAHW